MADPLILVTNDDGVHAPGIRALAPLLGGLGEVWIVAPDREVSASGQSLTITHPLRFENIEANVFEVDGTPADCVNLAIVKLLPRPPDVVVSGINRGANLGDDIAYSGHRGGGARGDLPRRPLDRGLARRARRPTTRPPPRSRAGSRRW